MPDAFLKSDQICVSSDIDLVLIGNWDQIPFEVVRRGIEQKNLAKPGSLQALEHATVITVVQQY